jgi:hypothetical protein
MDGVFGVRCLRVRSAGTATGIVRLVHLNPRTWPGSPIGDPGATSHYTEYETCGSCESATGLTTAAACDRDDRVIASRPVRAISITP